MSGYVAGEWVHRVALMVHGFDPGEAGADLRARYAEELDAVLAGMRADATATLDGRWRARTGKELNKARWGVVVHASGPMMTVDVDSDLGAVPAGQPSYHALGGEVGLRPALLAALGLRVTATPFDFELGAPALNDTARFDCMGDLLASPLHPALACNHAAVLCPPSVCWLVLGRDAPFTLGDACAAWLYVHELRKLAAAAPGRPFVAEAFQPHKFRAWVRRESQGQGRLRGVPLFAAAAERVELSGLQKAPHLNGTRGWRYGTGPVRDDRWSVALDATGKSAAVREGSMKVVDEPGLGDDMTIDDAVQHLIKSMHARPMPSPAPPRRAAAVVDVDVPGLGQLVLRSTTEPWQYDRRVKEWSLLICLPDQAKVGRDQLNWPALEDMFGHPEHAYTHRFQELACLAGELDDGTDVKQLGFRLPRDTLWFWMTPPTGVRMGKTLEYLGEQGLVYDLGFRILSHEGVYAAVQLNFGPVFPRNEDRKHRA